MTIQFLKNPDIIHWGFEGRWLADDVWGTWIAVPTGSNRWKGVEKYSPTSSPAVFCVPPEGWWHLHYNGPFSVNYTHFVDIVTPAVWVTPNRYEMIDLDLDVAIRVDGTIEVQDEDEFEIHQVAYGYTTEMIDGARRATEEIVAALTSRSEPFFDVAEAWLGRVE